MNVPDEPTIKPSRRPKNEAEGALHDTIMEHNLVPTKRGFPDFLVYGRGPTPRLLAMVEVKPHGNRSVKESQALLLRELARFGVPAFLWSPTHGFEPVGDSPSWRTIMEGDYRGWPS